MFKKKIKIYYFKAPGGKPNFGDELGPEIIQKLFSYLTFVYEPDIKKADLISVGSILHILLDLDFGRKNKRVNVWGSGTIYPLKANVASIKDTYPIHAFSSLDFSKIKFYSVRGELTRKDLNLSRLPLGDPGILSNLVYQKSNNPENKIGIIPHYAEMNHPLIQELANDSNYKIIDVLRSPQEVINDITSCRLIFSSSLHGLIVSDSFNIPNIHISLTNILVGGDFKFKDYYSGIGRSFVSASLSEVRDKNYQENLIENYCSIRNLSELQDNLLKVFPYRKLNFFNSLFRK